jgi:alpha-ketoglutarate-dependent taurine dioxygenase
VESRLCYYSTMPATADPRPDLARERVEVRLGDDHLTLVGAVTGGSDFHYAWLRDNCGCPRCRVSQSGERALFTATIPDDIAPTRTRVLTGSEGAVLAIDWNDGHATTYSLAWLLDHDYSRNERRPAFEAVLWDATLAAVPTFEHDDVVGTTEGQLAYLDAVRDLGVAVVRHVPPVEGEVERFAEKIGHVRETAFERIHNVRHDPTGYNVAHTPAELKPHTDLPSYHWPPSIQLLHFVVNETNGGESTVTDGWKVAEDLRRRDRVAFEVLARVPVGFQLFSSTEDTAATAPLIQLDPDGRIRVFRFSNQLATPLRASYDDVGAWYRAYRLLGRMIDGPEYKVAFKARTGDLLTVHGHRVMHGRLAFDPASGERHLQDVYMEFDDFMARRRVLLGHHVPAPATGGSA